MSAPGARIGVISNPGSGHNRDHFPAVRTALADCPGVVSHAVTTSADDIPQALSALAAAEAETLVINGGDGTVAAVLGSLLETRPFAKVPLIAVLPAGTANMTAGDVGLRGPLRAAVARLCRWAAASDDVRDQSARTERRLLRVDVNGALHHGMFLGAGAIISGTEYAHRKVHARGVRDDASLAVSTVRTVWGLVRQDPAFSASSHVSLSLDGGPARTHDAMILALSTLQRLSLGMRPFWGEGDGPMRLTIVDRGCRHFLPNFVGIVRGRPGRSARPERGYHSDNARCLHMTLDTRINLDGELLSPSGPVQVTATAPLAFLRL